MTVMTDTEGEAIPKSDDGYDLFDLSLSGDGDLSINIPWFETDNGTYESECVLECTLRDILQEYLRDGMQLDNGEGFIPLAKMLREFADAYEQAAKETT